MSNLFAMPNVLLKARRIAGRVKRHYFPTPEVAAWRHACQIAEQVPRYSPGEIQLGEYRLRYADLLSTCPQWEDIFVRQTMRVELDTATPRILDCGANIGLASLYIKRLYPAARITAYEADPTIHEILTDNLRRNRAADVETVQAAIWKENGSISFACEGADSGAVAEVSANTSATRREVPSIRLRDLLSAEPIDLLKLDIEGAERAVLADCAGALENVRAILMELHDFDPRQRNLPFVLELLEREGFHYTLDDLVSLPWVPPVAPVSSPFAGQAMCWGVMVKAWRQ
ncbi:MAG: FkbM family methyltransferase [Acidobacteria bacterium]|nr:FkbM family methyltransferase [Acidobacteriota bacterium]